MSKKKISTGKPERNKSSRNIKFERVENKYFVLGLLGVFLLLVYFATTFKVGGDDDFFWHLATGRYVVENKVVPDTDVFGYVTQGVEWIPFEWGWDVISYGLYKIGGYSMVQVFRSIVFIFIFSLLFVLFRKFKINSIVIFLVLFSLLVAIMDRLTPRPHILTYVFFIVLIYILVSFKYLNREIFTKTLYFLPPLFLLWGNIHMGVLAGGLVLFVFTVSEIIIYYKPAKYSTPEIRPLTKDVLVRLCIISVISALMLLVNPHGLHTYLYAYNHTKMKMLETINEWKSPFENFFSNGFVTNLYLIYIFCGILILIYAYKKKDLFIALLYIAFCIYSGRAVRFTVDFEIVMALFIAITLNYFITKPGLTKGRTYWLNVLLYNNSVKVIIAFFLLFVIANIPDGKVYNYLQYYRAYGYGIDDNYLAIQLMDFMKENNIKGRPFNHFGTGGTLVWYFPDQKNFIDSRNLNDDIFNEYYKILYMMPGFEKKLDEYGIDYVIYLDPDLIRRPNEMRNIIIKYLSRKSSWKLVFWDDKSFLFIKDEPKYADVIKKYEYKILNSFLYYDNPQDVMKRAGENSEQTKIELERKSSTEPNGIIFQNLRQNLIKTYPAVFK